LTTPSDGDSEFATWLPVRHLVSQRELGRVRGLRNLHDRATRRPAVPCLSWIHTTRRWGPSSKRRAASFAQLLAEPGSVAAAGGRESSASGTRGDQEFASTPQSAPARSGRAPSGSGSGREHRCVLAGFKTPVPSRPPGQMGFLATAGPPGLRPMKYDEPWMR
jgi:hypothetical protein